MKFQLNKWGYLIILSIVWGSSFILMKKGLVGLSPIEVGVFRMLFASVFLLLIGFKSLKSIEKRHWKYVTLTGFLGTFMPVFLFAYAINGIDSSIASILNSLTPFNTFIIGILLFELSIHKRQLIGIIIGLIGTVLLIANGASIHEDQNYWYSVLVIISSIGYGINVNVVKKNLSDLSPLSITTGNFVILIIPAFLVLVFSGFFKSFEWNEKTSSSLFYIFILAIIGTGIAKIMFNKLIHISSAIFSSSVTYLIPIVAVIWGILDGEEISFIQFMAGGIILFGVYLVNRKKRVKSIKI